MFHCIHSTSYFYLTESNNIGHINEFRLTLSPKGGNTKWDHYKEAASVTVFTSGWRHFLFYFNYHSTLDLRRKWQPTPVFLPGESHKQRSLVGWCPWGCRVGHDWSDFACKHALEKEMATHSSVLAWRIPGMGEPGGLPSMGSHRVAHDWSDLAAAAPWIFCNLKTEL